MKPTKTFKMKKSSKRLMGTILDDQKRSSFKRAMINAQLCSEVRVSNKESK